MSSLPGVGEPTQSHPLPHQSPRGDQRTHAVYAVQPVSTCFNVIALSPYRRYMFLYSTYTDAPFSLPGSLGSKRYVWFPVATTSPLWSLTTRYRQVLHEKRCKASRSPRPTP